MDGRESEGYPREVDSEPVRRSLIGETVIVGAACTASNRIIARA